MQGEGLFSRMIDKGLMALIVVGLVVYASIRPTTQLRPDMPPEFLDVSASWSPEKQAAEEKVARAYWECVVAAIQREYGLGQSLPLNPPPEFRITTESTAGAKDRATRLHYWSRLQHLWLVGDIWTAERAVDFGWLTEVMNSAGVPWVRYHAEMLLGRAETALEGFLEGK